MAQDPWGARDFEAMEIFSPSAPIDEADLFAGRQDQLRRMMEAVTERGRHAVLYGERGVGKTSLTNIFHLLMQPIVTRQLKPIRKQAGPTDNFSTLWKRAFDDIQVQIARDGGTETFAASEFYTRDIVPDDVLREFSALGPNLSPVIIFDEFDKLPDETSRRMMSHTIFQNNLNAFTEPGRGRILDKTGSQRAFKYRFAEPKMQPYVIMRAMSDQILPPGALPILSELAQSSLPID